MDNVYKCVCSKLKPWTQWHFVRDNPNRVQEHNKRRKLKHKMLMVYFIGAEQMPVMFGAEELLVMSMCRKISRVILLQIKALFLFIVLLSVRQTILRGVGMPSKWRRKEKNRMI